MFDRKRNLTEGNECAMMYNPQLETFVCVVEAGSFSKAAEKLFISPPAVIKQINSLEASLSLQLFIGRTVDWLSPKQANHYTMMQSISSITARTPSNGRKIQ